MSVTDSDYGALLGRLFAARRFGVRLELARIERCLERMGRPDRALPSILHVGGTNGKGSTCAFAEAMLRAGGARTGLFSSPHLSRFAERFLVDGRPASEASLIEAASRVEATDPDGELTFFEKATAMALALFSSVGVETAVLEVGLGGRFDATNAVVADVAVVTGVHFDHEQHLGTTLEAIAREKAGIFKAGRAAVVGASGAPEAVERLAEAARRAPVSRLHVVGEREVGRVPGPLGLRGPHQRRNAAAALAALDQLEALGLARVGAEARRAGLASAHLPGRMELLPGTPPVLVDGAHNPHAAGALARALEDLSRERLILVLAVSGDKDAGGIAGPLVARADDVIATRTRQERSLAPEALAARVAAATGAEPRTAAGAAAALALAADLAGDGDLVVVAGSLFLAAEAREAILGLQPDSLPLSDPLAVRRRTT